MKKIFKIIILFWCFFIGIGALCGGVCMLIKPSGEILHMQSLLVDLQKLPFGDVLFQDYIFSGIMLIIVNGITNILAAVLIIKDLEVGYILGSAFGFTLMLWITIQLCVFEPNFLDTIYMVFGVLQLICGYIAYVLYMENRPYVIDETNVNTNTEELVVYFSRCNSSKRKAYEIANKTGASIIELTTKEKTDGFLGFMWCGRFGMHKWPMSINETNLDLSIYKKITIVSPTWVFTPCGPIRDFLNKYKDNIQDFDFYLLHFMQASFKKTLKSFLDGYKYSNVYTCVARFGQVIETKKIL